MFVKQEYRKKGDLNYNPIEQITFYQYDGLEIKISQADGIHPGSKDPILGTYVMFDNADTTNGSATYFIKWDLSEDIHYFKTIPVNWC